MTKAFAFSIEWCRRAATGGGVERRECRRSSRPARDQRRSLRRGSPRTPGGVPDARHRSEKARGLGSRHSEREAFRLLAEEGLGEAETERTLADLGGPDLDLVEAAVVSYARETLWYEPASIQRRGRQLLQQLAPEQFLDLVGLASLANMVARLDFLVDQP